MQAGIRGAQHSPEGQWGTSERDTWFPWQPDRMEPLKLGDALSRFERSKCVLKERIPNFLVWCLLLAWQLCWIIHTAPVTPQHVRGILAIEDWFRHYFATLICCAFNTWPCGQQEKKYLFVLLQLRFHNDWIHMQTFPCMLKLSPKFQAVSCVSTRGGIWCGSEGSERTPNWSPLAVYLGGCAAAGMTEGFNLNIYKHLASDV